MKKLFGPLAIVLCMTTSNVAAFGVGTPQTYSKLVWAVSTSAAAFSNCTQLIIDATGDLINSNLLVLAGALNCTNGSGYAVAGALYTARDGSFSLMFTHGGFTTFCPRIVDFSGSCTTYDWAGTQRGTGALLLQ